MGLEEKLKPFEMGKEIRNYKKQLKQTGFKGDIRKAVAQQFNISESQVYKYEALLNINSKVQKKVEEGILAFSAVTPMANLSTEMQEAINNKFDEFIKENGKSSLTRGIAQKIIAEVKNPNKEIIKKTAIEEEISNDFEIDYVKVEKSMCKAKKMKIPYRWLEVIIEMGIDYKEILNNKIEEDKLEGYAKALYEYKIKQIETIVKSLSENIGYSKKCKIKKKEENIGAEAFSLGASKMRE